MPRNVVTINGNALQHDIIAQIKHDRQGKTVIFLDPERPASAAERHLFDVKPDIKEFLLAYRIISEDIAIELPPFLKDIPFACEREYLSIDGRLNRLTIYTGALRRCDISVVKLPGEVRLEHNGVLPHTMSTQVIPRFILEPDAALAHAGLSAAALSTPVREVIIGVRASGNRSIFLSKDCAKSPFFTSFKILAMGKDVVIRALPKADCAIIIIHGHLTQDAQRALLKELSTLCKGRRRLHLFIADNWYLTAKVPPADDTTR